MLHTQPGWNKLCVLPDFSRHLQSEGIWIKGSLASDAYRKAPTHRGRQGPLSCGMRTTNARP